MRRFAVYLVLVVLTSILATTTALAQRRPARPPRDSGGGGIQPMCVSGCGEDEGPPTIVLNAPLGGFTTQYPFVEVQFCDDQSLNQSSYWVKVNNVYQTAQFTYQSVSPDDFCMSGVRAIATTSSVSFSVGENTIRARICDNAGQCTTSQTWTVTRLVEGPPVVALRNQNGDNQDRGFCLTLGAGQSAGIGCGDLFVAHPMPVYRTKGRDRSLTLLYGSIQADPRPAVAVVVSQPPDRGTPSSVFARLSVGGTVRDSATYWPIASSAPKQIVLAFDAAAAGLATGIYSFSMLVRNRYAEPHRVFRRLG